MFKVRLTASISKLLLQPMPEALTTVAIAGEIVNSTEPEVVRLLHFIFLFNVTFSNVASQDAVALLSLGSFGSVLLAVPPPNDNE